MKIDGGSCKWRNHRHGLTDDEGENNLDDLNIDNDVIILDGRTRATVIAESIVRVVAAIRITSVRWESSPPAPPPQKSTEIGPYMP